MKATSIMRFRVILIVMTLCGFMAGLAGIVSMGRPGSALPQEVVALMVNVFLSVKESRDQTN